MEVFLRSKRSVSQAALGLGALILECVAPSDFLLGLLQAVHSFELFRIMSIFSLSGPPIQSRASASAIFISSFMVVVSPCFPFPPIPQSYPSSILVRDPPPFPSPVSTYSNRPLEPPNPELLLPPHKSSRPSSLSCLMASNLRACFFASARTSFSLSSSFNRDVICWTKVATEKEEREKKKARKTCKE